MTDDTGNYRECAQCVNPNLKGIHEPWCAYSALVDAKRRDKREDFDIECTDKKLGAWYYTRCQEVFASLRDKGVSLPTDFLLASGMVSGRLMKRD